MTGLTKTQAERICCILCTRSLDTVGFHVGDAGIAKPLAKYLRESVTLQRLGLAWSKTNEEDEGEENISRSAMTTIFDAVGESRSLEFIQLLRPHVSGDAAFVAKLLASAITKSPSLEEVESVGSDQEFLRMIQSALKYTEAVRDFDLCFSVCEEEQNVTTLKLERNCRWKQVLSQNVRLALWPRILAKTKTWNTTSHSSLDALFFLTKEKSDVLLQNVHRRKIRKRKRFQFT
jgi:hypothetical protein